MKQIIYSKEDFLKIIHINFGRDTWRIRDLVDYFPRFRYDYLKNKVNRYNKLSLLSRTRNSRYKISEIGMRRYVEA